MKKNYHVITNALILLCGLISSSGHAKRLVLLEEFTNTGCGPCASFAPLLDELMDSRLGDVVVIRNHAYFPASNDPWYLGDKEGLDSRLNTYSIDAVPATFIDGTMTENSIESINHLIDERLALPELVNLTASSSMEDNTLSISIDAEALENLDYDNLRLHVAVIEEEYISPHHLGNGETEFRNCVAKYVTGADGFDMNSLSKAGDKSSYSTSWEIAGIYDITQIGVVAFIQDMNTKEVIATVYIPRAPDTNDGARIVELIGAPTKICSTHYSVGVRFRNIGENPLTSCNICVEINGEVQKTPWSGNLQYLETEFFQSPDFTEFTLADENEKNVVNIYLSDINGTPIQSEPQSSDFDGAPRCEYSAQLSVFTDNKPEETSYVVYDSNDEVIYSSEPFTEKRKFYKTILPLLGEDCFRVVFTDTGEDGIAGDAGNGYFSLYQINAEGKSKLILQDTFREKTASFNFQLCDAADVELLENVDSSDWKLEGTEFIPLTAGQLVVADMKGRIVLSQALNAEESVDLTSIGAEIYLLTFYTDSKSSRAKILVR